jgi:hypothetical protein
MVSAVTIADADQVFVGEPLKWHLILGSGGKTFPNRWGPQGKPLAK